MGMENIKYANKLTKKTTKAIYEFWKKFTILNSFLALTNFNRIKDKTPINKPITKFSTKVPIANIKIEPTKGFSVKKVKLSFITFFPDQSLDCFRCF